MGLWYLSFCDTTKPKGTQFLGACIVEAFDAEDAVTVSKVAGCNPGGEVALWEMPDAIRGEMRARGFAMNKLITLDQMGPVVRPHDHGFDAHATVCQGCNDGSHAH